MGAEKAQMINLNLAVQGKPFEVVRSNTVNQKGLGCALNLFDAQRRGKPEMIAGAAREFRDFVEQQIGTFFGSVWGDESGRGLRVGACGLYALLPNRPGLVRAECRTTSHCHLHYAWLGSGLLATREYRAPVETDAALFGAHGKARLELKLLSVALLDWLHQELSWSSVCYVEGVGVLAPNRRHRRGKTHEIVLTSPDRDNLYRLFTPDLECDQQYARQAAKTTNVQQLGFRAIDQLYDQQDAGVIGVARALNAGQLQMPVFWDRLEVARRDNELIAWVVDMERKGRDDTHLALWNPRVDKKPKVDTVAASEVDCADWEEMGWTRTTFYAHDDKEVA